MTGNPEIAGGGRLVLIADDNPLIRLGLGEVLRRLGFDARVVSDGQAALDELEGGEYAIAFLDLNMPVMNGIDCIREIRRRESEGGPERLPVIAITGEQEMEAREECLSAGADDVLTKPFTVEKLSGVLGRWFPAVLSSPAPAPASEEGEGAAPGRKPSQAASLSSKKIAEIRRLEAEGATDLMRRMVELFRASSRELVEELGRSLSDGNVGGVADAAHELKSSSGSVGGERLRMLCSDMERLGRKGTLDGAEGLLSLIRAERQAVLGALSEELSSEHS